MSTNQRMLSVLEKIGLTGDLKFTAEDILDIVGQSMYNALELSHEELVEEIPFDSINNIKYVLETLVEYKFLRIGKDCKYYIDSSFCNNI